MADNKSGIAFGGPWRYGWQSGMTNKLGHMTVQEYTRDGDSDAESRSMMKEWRVDPRRGRRHKKKR